VRNKVAVSTAILQSGNTRRLEDHTGLSSERSTTLLERRELGLGLQRLDPVPQNRLGFYVEGLAVLLVFKPLRILFLILFPPVSGLDNNPQNSHPLRIAAMTLPAVPRLRNLSVFEAIIKYVSVSSSTPVPLVPRFEYCHIDLSGWSSRFVSSPRTLCLLDSNKQMNFTYQEQKEQIVLVHD
jgi:hypothetical protein